MFALRNFRDEWKRAISCNLSFRFYEDNEKLLEDIAMDRNDGARQRLLNRLHEDECDFTAVEVAKFARFSKKVATIEAERAMAACYEGRMA